MRGVSGTRIVAFTVPAYGAVVDDRYVFEVAAEPSDEGCESVLHTTWREQLPQILIAVVAAVTVFYLLRRMLTASSAEPGVDPDD